MSENLLPYPAFYAAWEVAKKHGLEARTASGTWYGITGDIVREMLDAARRASDATPADERDDTIDGLRSDLEAAVEVAYKRGATEWVRLNYPDQFKKLSAASPAPVPGDLVDGRGLLSDVPEMDLVEWLRWYGFGRCPEAADRIEALEKERDDALAAGERLYGDLIGVRNEVPTRFLLIPPDGGDVPTDEAVQDMAKRIAALEQALRSIARNSCCDKCQEAALVARAALGENNDSSVG